MEPSALDMQVALIGLAGAFVGGLMTGLGQLIAMWRANVAARAAVNREERKKVYLEALWGLRAVRQAFRLSLLAEADARRRGEAFVPPPMTEWEALERTLLEASILADSRVHRELDNAAQAFRQWVMGLDPEGPISGFADLEAHLADVEAALRAVIRADLQVADKRGGS